MARGSAFCVAGPSTGVIISLVSAHVAAPHRYRRYFPAEWLSFVRDEHVQCHLEVRSESGDVEIPSLVKIPLVASYRHSSLDVAAMIVGDATAAALQGLHVLSLSTAGPEQAVGESVIIHGHCLDGRAGSESELVRPVHVGGRVSLIDGESRGFVDTSGVETVMGMCGGPVLNMHGDVVGLLEGLVPSFKESSALSPVHKGIMGHSAFVTSKSLRLFVAEVEQVWRESKKQSNM